MRHIARVDIENFQSHAHSVLEFSGTLNVIIGPSDHGKSAVLRAIRWALYNEPRGSDFVRSGARECRVAVTMSDGVQVVRELILTRSGSTGRNRYLVRAPGAEEQVFEGFGSDVPAEVLRAHGMPQVLLDTDKRVLLSFGTQLEGPFLMAETGSFRARAIGRLLGVHVVDAAGRNTQRDLLSVRKEIQRLERDLERYDNELQAYADIPRQEEQVERAGAALAQAEELQRKLEQLGQVRERLDRTERESVLTGANLSRLEGVGGAEQAVRRAEQQNLRAQRLSGLSQELGRIQHDSRTFRARVDALSALPLAEERARGAAERQNRLTALGRLSDELRRRAAEQEQIARSVARVEQADRAATLLNQVSAAVLRLDRLVQKQAPLREAEQRLAAGREHLAKVEADLAGHLTEYEQVLRRLGRCPTCMQPVRPEAIPKILAELTGGPPSGHQH